MKKQAGVWIDHQRARIVCIADRDNEPPRFTSVPFDAKRSRRAWKRALSAARSDLDAGLEGDYRMVRGEQMTRFYDRVIDEARAASEIVLLGPDAPRIGLSRRLAEGSSKEPVVIASQQCGYVTDEQLAIKVRAILEEAQ